MKIVAHMMQRILMHAGAVVSWEILQFFSAQSQLNASRLETDTKSKYYEINCQNWMNIAKFSLPLLTESAGHEGDIVREEECWVGHIVAAAGLGSSAGIDPDTGGRSTLTWRLLVLDAKMVRC